LAKKSRTLFRCSVCGGEAARWAGKCPACGEWNSLEEVADTDRTPSVSVANLASLSLLSEINPDDAERISSGLGELDLVLGGGFVPGALILIGGEPGVGKSTLLLEIARRFTGMMLYFSGEESAGQIRLRADRMEIHSRNIYISQESELETIAARIRKERPSLVVIDSIQTVYRSGFDSLPGSVNQLRDAAFQLMELSKETRIPIVMTGHITKEGSIAGPRLLEHMVDAVLYFESDRLNHFRILRAMKNRFGPVGEVALFEMKQEGLGEVGRLKPGLLSYDVPGRVFSVFVEGSRALGVEVQALVSRTPFGAGRRMAEGLDSRRLILMAAVLEKFMKVSLADSDIFANLAGGLSSDDPGLDLSLCVAILSSYRELPAVRNAAYIGEVGLSGEVRPVGRIQSRIKELSVLGFDSIYLPEANCDEGEVDGIKLFGVAHISDILKQ